MRGLARSGCLDGGRALSADEIAELYHDPYGMFRHNRALVSVGAKPWLYRPKTLMVGGV